LLNREAELARSLQRKVVAAARSVILTDRELPFSPQEVAELQSLSQIFGGFEFIGSAWDASLGGRKIAEPKRNHPT
jgi:hypothetical protein